VGSIRPAILIGACVSFIERSNVATEEVAQFVQKRSELFGWSEASIQHDAPVPRLLADMEGPKVRLALEGLTG